MTLRSLAGLSNSRDWGQIEEDVYKVIHVTAKRLYMPIKYYFDDITDAEFDEWMVSKKEPAVEIARETYEFLANDVSIIVEADARVVGHTWESGFRAEPIGLFSRDDRYFWLLGREYVRDLASAAIILKSIKHVYMLEEEKRA